MFSLFGLHCRTRKDIIGKLTNFLGFKEAHDPDPSYALNVDNFVKMLAILVRFRSVSIYQEDPWNFEVHAPPFVDNHVCNHYKMVFFVMLKIILSNLNNSSRYLG